MSNINSSLLNPFLRNLKNLLIKLMDGQIKNLLASYAVSISFRNIVGQIVEKLL